MSPNPVVVLCLAQELWAGAMAVPRQHHDLTMLDVRDGAVFVDMDIEAVGLVILGDHHARLDDPVLLREVLLAETLPAVSVDRCSSLKTRRAALPSRCSPHREASFRQACWSTRPSSHPPCWSGFLERREAWLLGAGG